MSIHFYSEYIDTAMENVPEEMKANQHLQEALGYLDDVIDNYEQNYIERGGDFYNELIHEARDEGAEEMKDRILDRLREIQYRAVLFQEGFDVQKFMDEMRDMEVRHENYS